MTGVTVIATMFLLRLVLPITVVLTLGYLLNRPSRPHLM
jgi:hypothetical protein